MGQDPTPKYKHSTMPIKRTESYSGKDSLIDRSASNPEESERDSDWASCHNKISRFQNNRGQSRDSGHRARVATLIRNLGADQDVRRLSQQAFLRRTEAAQ